jgi:hypothetical protein
MAFLLDRTWDQSDLPLDSAGGSAAFAPFLANGHGRNISRACATLLSAIVHVVLIWMLLNRLAGDPGPGETARAGQRGLMQFDLSDGAPASGSAEQRLVRLEAPVTSEVDVSIASDLPPPEWTVSQLPPAADPQRPSRASTADAGLGAASGVGGTGAGEGPGRGGGYDPYAGAAPQWRSSEDRAEDRSPGGRVLGFAGLGQPSTGGLVLDEAVLEAIRRGVAGAWPGRAGTVELVLRVSPTGMVLEAKARSGSAPADVMDAFARALIGKRLYRGSATTAQTVILPGLSLG